MGKETGIQWAHHTWNPWRGCARVSPGCDHCYAEAMSRRNPAVLGVWGDPADGGTRVMASTATRRAPLAWDAAARAAGERRRVFCGSLMDFFEDLPQLLAPRAAALATIDLCRALDWLLLTKRPENVYRLLDAAGGWRLATRPQVWVGCTVEDNARARARLPVLAAVPAAVRFVSCEPLLEEVDLSPWLAAGAVDWVIVGGESSQGGATARGFELEWAESLVGQCRAAGVACFVKQLGSRPIAAGLGLRLADRHGGDPAEWPDWLQVRQFPHPRA